MSEMTDNTAHNPLDASLVKAAETLIAQGLESHREVCKTMITVTTTSLGAYVALLGLVSDKAKLAEFLKCNTLLAALPIVLFAIAASMHIGGYFHDDQVAPTGVLKSLVERKADAIQEAINKTISRRRRYLWRGNIAYWIAAATGLYVAYLMHTA